MMATLEPIAVTMTEAARLLGVSRPTVYPESAVLPAARE